MKISINDLMRMIIPYKTLTYNPFVQINHPTISII